MPRADFDAAVARSAARVVTAAQKPPRRYWEIVREAHRNAPRGGSALNRFGERRSAPGEPPAMETGRLFALIDQGLELTDRGGSVVSNYAVLERGYALGNRARISDKRELSARRQEPRPLAQLATALLKEEIRRGSER